jgi:hypothetical protein
MKTQWMAVSATALLLVACGGGGDVDVQQANDPLAAVPASASQSTQGMVSYLGALPPLDAEAREPVPLNALMLPTSETDEPQDVGG